MGRVRPLELPRVRRRIDALWAAIDRIELTVALARRAGDLAEQHALRAYDAVHLASVEQVGDSELALVSDDDDLVQAARAIGITTVQLA